jgi:Holliday junction resolvase RusA-like endonuclease
MPEVDEDSGELTFLIRSAPVSLQATPERKEALRNLIRDQTSSCAYLITGDVQIGIEWLLSERRRYESHVSPDVDNVLKPTLDALCGPNGVLIDDCQVQAVSCRWIDWTREEEQFEIRLRFFPDERVSKVGVVFVHMGQSLCFPFDKDMPPLALMIVVNMVVGLFDSKDELVRRGIDYQTASRVMPVQRLFNRSRIIAKFPVEDLPAFMRSVEAAARAAATSASPRETDLYKRIAPEYCAQLQKAERRFA